MNAHKRSLLVICTLALLAACTLPSQAVESQTRLRKLGRGISDVVFGVIEVPKNIIEINRTYGDSAGLTWGTLRGLERWWLREKNGVIEIFTCMSASAPRVEPEFYFRPEGEEIDWYIRREGEWY